MRRVGEAANRKLGKRVSRKVGRVPVVESEEELRAALLEAFRSVRGMEIEDVFPVSSERDEVRR